MTLPKAIGTYHHHQSIDYKLFPSGPQIDPLGMHYMDTQKCNFQGSSTSSKVTMSQSYVTFGLIMTLVFVSE